MVNLLLASGAAIIGAAAGAFGRDLIINKTVVVDATDLSDPKVVLQPKREKKKKFSRIILSARKISPSQLMIRKISWSFYS